MFVLGAFTDGYYTRGSWHLTGTALIHFTVIEAAIKNIYKKRKFSEREGKTMTYLGHNSK